MFVTDNSSSSHADNSKKYVLVSGEGPTYDINGGVGNAEQTFSINFSKAKTKFCLGLHYNGGSSYLFVYRFHADNKNVSLPKQFFHGYISEKMSNQKKHHLKDMFMIFQLVMTLLINLKFSIYINIQQSGII